MANKVTLLEFWASPYAMSVKIGLAEKGIEFESIEEDQLKKKSTFLLEINPIHKKIPVLIHNGKPVCESFIILQYIDEVWAEQPTLFPSDPYERAQVRFWADINDKVILALRKVYIGKRDVYEAARKELIWGFMKLLEGELGDKNYFGGEIFGVLDMLVIPTSSWFHALEIYGSLSLIEECPMIVNWVNRCLQRDSVAKSLPDQLKVYEFSLKAKMILEALYQTKS